MKIFAFIFFLFVFYGCGIIPYSGEQQTDLISSDHIYKHIAFLASDSLQGRDTPSPGLDTAASYIASEFRKYRLKPVNNSYFQKIDLGIINLGVENSLKVIKDGKESSFNIKTDFIPFEMTANKGVTAPVIFAGYGITAPEYNYDDYKDINAAGKIVLILKHEPGENDSLSVFDGLKLTDYSKTSEKVKNAIAHGAVGVIIVNDPLNHLSLAPQGFPWPSLYKIIPKDALPLQLISKIFNRVPVINAGGNVIKELFGSVDSLKSIQKAIDSNLSPKSFDIKDLAVSIKTSTDVQNKKANNVVGYVEGSDPVLKDELLVIGAHYDHVGIKKEHLPGTDSIYNGADDNASGTSALLAVAEEFGSLKIKPKRSILFIAFAGEEKGLYGSENYVNYPLFPLEKTAAMLNLDMVGRNNPDSLQIEGASRCPELKAINEEMNKRVGFSFIYDDGSLAQSDQANFLRENIPALFFTSGLEPEYHQVTDEIPLVNTKKIAKVSRLVFYTAQYIANDNKHYKLLSKKVTLF